jgi:DNA topoisomerase I
MKLLVVESPGKIKKLRSFLKGDWKILASVGHVCDLPKKNLGIDFSGEKVKVRFELNRDKEGPIEGLKAAAKIANEIYLATDPDREGEAIAYHVGMLLGKEQWGKIKRITFNEITERAVSLAVSTPRRLDLNLVHAQQARRVVDRLVGYQVSPLLWKEKDMGNSAGRVQSVALRLVVEREREIVSFIPQEFWNIDADLSGKQDSTSYCRARLQKFDGRHIVSRIEEGKDRVQHIIGSVEEAEEIKSIVKAGEWKVKKKETKDQKRRPSAPFVTSTLQQSGHRLKKWPPTKTMQIAQSLYEQGLITYMRTDAPVISKEALGALRSFIQTTLGEKYLPKTPFTYKAKDKRSQEAHECIRPVEVTKLASSLTTSAENKWLYELIWKQYVACQVSEAIYAVGELEIEAERSVFFVKGKQLKFDGWLRVTGSGNEAKAKKEEDVALLPPLEVGEVLNCKDVLISQLFTKAVPRFTGASLIKTLETRSIGRPSTYAAILSNIKDRGYFFEEDHVIHASKTGERLVDYLMARFNEGFMDIEFTARMEDTLDQVASGEAGWESVVRGFQSALNKQLAGRN